MLECEELAKTALKQKCIHMQINDSIYLVFI